MRGVVASVLVLPLTLLALAPLHCRILPVELPELDAADDRIAASGRTSVAAIDRGRGPVVVRLHGVPGQAADWLPRVDPLVAPARGARLVSIEGRRHVLPARRPERLAGRVADFAVGRGLRP